MFITDLFLSYKLLISLLPACSSSLVLHSFKDGRCRANEILTQAALAEISTISTRRRLTQCQTHFEEREQEPLCEPQ
jgi:hypothetical protein